EILAIILGDAADGGDIAGSSDRGRQILVRHLLSCEPGGISDYLELADVARLHLHAAHARNAREERPDLIRRDVIQRRRITALEVVRDDGKERWRESLDLDVESLWQRGAHLIDTRLHLLQRELHVGFGREGDVDLRGAANGA